NRGRVIVRIGTRSVVILPDHAIDLGTLSSDEVIVVLTSGSRPGQPAGYQVYAAKSDVWSKVGLDVQQGTTLPATTEGIRHGRRLDCGPGARRAHAMDTQPTTTADGVLTLKTVRGCDGCTLCCKVMEVKEIAKPGGKWCAHCKTGTGCGIYDS